MRARFSFLVAIVILLACTPRAACAQQRVSVFDDTTAAVAFNAAWAIMSQEPAAEPPVGRVIGGGIILGLIGFAAGGLLAGNAASECSSHDWCELEAAFYGAAAGGTLGMATGVHLGNRRRGNFLADFAVGAAVWAAGIGIASLSDWNETVTWTAFVGIPIAQLAGTVAVERATGRKRAANR